MSQVKRPAFQFYPADWRKDAALQSCSMAAQGLWVNLLCVMHECEPYGHLSVNTRPMKVEQVARLVGLPAKECAALLAELSDAGVSGSADGFLMSRRMVRDERLRNVRAAAGRLGGNPALLGSKVNQLDNQDAKQSPTPSSSSSSSKRTPKAPKGAGTVHEFPPGFERFWAAYPKKVGKDEAAKAFAKRKPDEQLLLAMLAAIEAQRALPLWGKDGGQYIPNPATWLNQGRWQDETDGPIDQFAGAR